MHAVEESTIQRALPFVIKSIRRGEPQKLFEMLANGFPVTERIGSYNLIQYAVLNAPTFKIVQVLINCGANAFETTMDGRNLVHLCCRAKRVKMLEGLWPYLVASKITRALNARTQGGTTPLMMAIQSGSTSTVAMCLNAGMNGQDENYLGRKCADIAKQSCTEEVAEQIVSILETYK